MDINLVVVGIRETRVWSYLVKRDVSTYYAYYSLRSVRQVTSWGKAMRSYGGKRVLS